MPAPPVEMLLIRHAEACHGGRLVGRSDVDARLPDEAALTPLRAALSSYDMVCASPAKRCRMTAAALWPDVSPRLLPDLWEQDFGQHEGVAFADLPDLGPLSLPDLAVHRAPGGESFLDMYDRAAPALRALAAGAGPRIAVVAHAGTVRAALGLALGDPSKGLAFEVAPLSGTLLRWFDGGVSIARTNGPLA